MKKQKVAMVKHPAGTTGCEWSFIVANLLRALRTTNSYKKKNKPAGAN
jgi:hypothetical protein